MYTYLKVKDFGPIKSGYNQNDGYIPLGKMSVFCGTQGTGKSTIAKLCSTFVWLEKALVRGDFPASYVEQYNRFERRCLAYQGISGYVKGSDSYIHYKGIVFDFLYKNEKFKVLPHTDSINYERPQIMYYPAERNLISVIENVSNVKGMPNALEAMLDEYNIACRSLTQDLQLPINGVYFHYDKSHKISSIIGKDHKVRMSESSSGFQSLTPLFITMNYLSGIVRNGADNNVRVSLEEKMRIDKRITELLLDDTLDNDVRTNLIKKMSDNKNKRLISIVEEPEQNLSPESQESILYSMLRLAAMGKDQLLLTTHSPYILNYLMLAIKAKQVENVVKNEDDMKELDAIVPRQSRIGGNDVSVFQLSLDGTISLLSSYNDIPSDDNYLNLLMMQVNSKYSSLVEIQSRYE